MAENIKRTLKSTEKQHWRLQRGELEVITKMEECESLDSEMTELQEFQSEASEAISQDDEDEVEELQNRCYTHWILQAE